jgi:hypothetical protein
MATAYLLQEHGETVAMTRVRCRNEEEELQRLLEANPNLLPGDQIDPEDPCRWLLVKREMPVHDPGTGDIRWSVDLFLVDQNGVPTFVECKRFDDTRSRREVVAQMIEYAANGKYYWTREMIRGYAEKTASEGGRHLEEAILTLQPDSEADVDGFLEIVENNLREGQVRLVFFLEESPHELRSMVEFLNNQMERTEVLIVEARQFEKNGVRVVVPTLFGYRDEARRIKKTVTVQSGGRRQWDEGTFFDDATAHLPESEVERLRSLYKLLSRFDRFVLRWGTGKTYGSINIVFPDVSTRALLTITSRARVWLNFDAFSEDEEKIAVRTQLAEWARKIGLELPQDFERRYPNYSLSAFGDDLNAAFEGLLTLGRRYAIGRESGPSTPPSA